MYKETQAVELDARQIHQTMGVGKSLSKAEMIDSSISSLGDAVRELHEFIDSLNGPPPGNSSLGPSTNVPIRPFMEVIGSAPEMIHMEAKGVREAILRLRGMLS